MKKIFAIVITLILIFGPAAANALTVEDVQLLVAAGIIPADKVAKVMEFVDASSVKKDTCVSIGNSAREGDRDYYYGGPVSKLQNNFLIPFSFNDKSLNIGVFDIDTKNAVKNFQRTVGMFNVNSSESQGYGMVGPRTRKAIYEYSCSHSPTVQSVTKTYDYGNDSEDDEIIFQSAAHRVINTVSREIESSFLLDEDRGREDEWYMAGFCDDNRDVIQRFEREYDAEIRCLERDYSVAISLQFDDFGDDHIYCTDTNGYRGSGAISTLDQNSIVYCAHGYVDFSEVRESERIQRQGVNTIQGIKDKGINAAIKANLNNARVSAELYFDDNSSYKGVCSSTNSGSVLKVVEAVKELTDDVICYDYADSWALHSKLYGDEGSYCVDSSGYAGISDIKREGGVRAYCVEGE